ncbi:MAG: ABC transporter permease [Brevinematales bacterium]|nr:ABC transporter permease [Brevinematales bacterium]
MFMFLKVALRNVFRSKVRSILTVLSIVVGVVSLMILNGYFEYSKWGLRESMIRGGIGHFQIYQKGFTEVAEEGSYEKLIENYKKPLRELYEIGGISSVAPRLRFQGILSSGDVSTITIGFGGWSEEELKLNSFGNLVEGSFISDDDKSGVIIASGLARKLRAKVGDYLTLMTTTKGGGINAIDVRVKGIMTLRIEEYNNTFMIVPLALVQEVANVGESVDRLVVVLQNTDDTEKVEKEVKKFCDTRDFEYRSWKDLAVFYWQVRDMYQSIIGIVLTVVLFIVIFAISNTITMNVYDRFREIGTIRAIGARRIVVVKQFVLESTVMGGIGVIAGLILGGVLALLINASGGIYIPPPPGNTEGYYAFITPNPIDILVYCVLFVIASILASLIPSYRASRMNIVDTLRSL